MVDFSFSGVNAPKPEIVVLLDHEKLSAWTSQVILQVKKKLDEEIKGYKIDVAVSHIVSLEGHGELFSVSVFNGHMLYEAVTVENNEIIYPIIKKKVEDCVQGVIQDFESKFDHKAPISDEEQNIINHSKKRVDAILGLKETISVLSNKTHTKYSVFSKSFHLYIGENIFIVVKDYSGETILACSPDATYVSIDKAIEALEKIEVEASIQAEKICLNSELKQSIQFGSIKLKKQSLEKIAQDDYVIGFVSNVGNKLSNEIYPSNAFPELDKFLIKWFGKSFHFAIHNQATMTEMQ